MRRKIIETDTDPKYIMTMNAETKEYLEKNICPQKCTFVNIYEDKEGKFIGDTEYNSFREAFKNRDKLSSYLETVEIRRVVSIKPV